MYATTRYNFVHLKATHKISPLEELVGGRSQRLTGMYFIYNCIYLFLFIISVMLNYVFVYLFILFTILFTTVFIYFYILFL